MKKKLKILSLILLLGILAVAPFVQATETTATFGDQNSDGDYRIEADTDGLVTINSGTGIKQLNNEVATTSDTLTAAETGKTIVTTGSGTSTFTLPDAADGLTYTFITGNTREIHVDPQSGDTIKYTTNSAGDKLTSSATLGDSLEVYATDGSSWYIRDVNGTWTDGN